MHELSLAMSLVEEVEAIAKRESATRVLTISLSIGDLSGVDREAFLYAFPLAAERTLLEDARLEVKRIRTRIVCRDCGEHTEPEEFCCICGKCGSRDVEIAEGQEFNITSLEIE